MTLERKYTTKINNFGGVCFYGHEAKSADLFHELCISGMFSNVLTCGQEQIIETAIRYHMELKNIHSNIGKECFKIGLRRSLVQNH